MAIYDIKSTKKVNYDKSVKLHKSHFASKSIFNCKSNFDIYKQNHKPLYITKTVLPEISEWERVKEMRLINDPRIFGGKKS